MGTQFPQIPSPVSNVVTTWKTEITGVPQVSGEGTGVLTVGDQRKEDGCREPGTLRCPVGWVPRKCSHLYQSHMDLRCLRRRPEMAVGGPTEWGQLAKAPESLLLNTAWWGESKEWKVRPQTRKPNSETPNGSYMERSIPSLVEERFSNSSVLFPGLHLICTEGIRHPSLIAAPPKRIINQFYEVHQERKKWHAHHRVLSDCGQRFSLQIPIVRVHWGGRVQTPCGGGIKSK